MRRLAVLLAAVLLSGLATPAYAGGRQHGGSTAANVALGLASFAVFNQLVGGFVGNRNGYRHQRTVVYEQQVYVAPAPPVIYQYQPVPMVYSAPTVVIAPPAPPPPQTVYYPHGRYELSGQQWVWISNLQPAPPAAEPCRFTGRSVRTPQGVLPECQ